MAAEAFLIRVWPFHEAPQEFQALSQHGGDEDYVMHIPAAMVGDFWVEYATCEGDTFGYCSVDSYGLPDGSQVRIGAHA